MKHLPLIILTSLTTACVVEATEPPEGNPAPLEISVNNDTTFAGSFTHAGSVIEFSVRSEGEQHAILSLEVNGAQVNVNLDLAARTFSQDGHLNALYEDDLAALLALRDAVEEQYPDLVTNTLRGKLLARHADFLAEAPVGQTLDVRHVNMQTAAVALTDRAGADGCGDDGVRCLHGTDGYTNAKYDPGSNGTCVWTYARYGKKAPHCNGRCGSGCSWWDHNYTQDCFDHDKCLDAYGGNNYPSNPNCGDEFNDAIDDYAVTYDPWYC